MSLLNFNLTEKNKEFITKLNRIYDRQSSSSCMSKYHPPNEHNIINPKIKNSQKNLH
jgi:hypothetical protein